MDSVIRTGKVTMINLAGSLREVNQNLVPELKAQGWKQVTNPKRDYFPELDTTNKNFKAKNQMGSDIDDEDQNNNILVYENV